jgi:DNA-binding transcriptional LysR family regulator
MDATDLKVFEAVARHGSMNRAATELNTVQSNVTARVRALEVELGVLLFQRHARGVKVTPAGRRMLPFSARISRLLSDAKAAARDDGVPGGVLEVGTLETTAALRLPMQARGRICCGAGRPSGFATGERLSRRAGPGNASLNSRH